MHVHAIGDQAVSDALDAIDATGGQGRHRITHVELVAKQDIPRFKQQGVIADFQPSPYFQPSFLKSNEPMIGDRAYAMLPMRELYDSGARVTLSSDWDVNPVSPLGIMQNALSLGGRSLPSLEAAVKAYTLDAAYTLRQEKDTGSLEVGKQADLVVLDQNIFDLPIKQVGQAKVLWTLLGGEETYRDKNF
ncbi:amidohydrolase family protein [Pseudomonas anguilliseptica]|nr:amidohydrolase family protein [Pseudomonas anguilliseptica]